MTSAAKALITLAAVIFTVQQIPFTVLVAHAAELNPALMRVHEDVSILHIEQNGDGALATFQSRNRFDVAGGEIELNKPCLFNITPNNDLWKGHGDVSVYVDDLHFLRIDNGCLEGDRHIMGWRLPCIAKSEIKPQMDIIHAQFWMQHSQLGAKLTPAVFLGKSNGILRSLSGFLGSLNELLGAHICQPHFVELALHGAPLQERYYGATASYDGDHYREDANLARPSGYNPFIPLVIGLLLLGLGGISMVLAFKSAEKADDYGFTWWWCPLVVFAILSLFLLGQGVKFLGRFDDILESKAAYTIAASEALAGFQKISNSVSRKCIPLQFAHRLEALHARQALALSPLPLGHRLDSLSCPTPVSVDKLTFFVWIESDSHTLPGCW